MSPLDRFFKRRRQRRLARIAEIAERRRSIIMDQIAARIEDKAEWKPLVGKLQDSTHEALAAECGIEWESVFPDARERRRVEESF